LTITELVVAFQLTAAGTWVPSAVRRWTASAVGLAMGSLNPISTLAASPTLLAPAAGVRDTTVGATVSPVGTAVRVVSFQLSACTGMPATSVTPAVSTTS
jgi:hypothetical protein